MPARINLIGMKFGRLTVDSLDAENGKWRCVCDCGKVVFSVSGNLKSGNTKSCGCFHSDNTRAKLTTHGKTRGSEYRIWNDMVMRCHNPNRKTFADYGGRGITVCDSWRNFVNFYQDMGDRPSPKHTIERVDNNGNYEPKNCVWLTMRGQCNNRRSNKVVSFNGKTMTHREWERYTGLSRGVVWMRIHLGWTPEMAVSTKTLGGKS